MTVGADLVALAVHGVLISAPQFWLETPVGASSPDDIETPEARSERLWPVSQEITLMANSRPYGLDPATAAAIPISLGRFETHWARYVWVDCTDPPEKAKGWACDPDQDGVPQSRTYFQVQQKACPLTWLQEPSSRLELRAAIRCSVKRFMGSKSRCRGRNPAGNWAGGFAGYRSVGITDCQGYAERAMYLTTIQARLWAPCAASSCGGR